MNTYIKPILKTYTSDLITFMIRIFSQQPDNFVSVTLNILKNRLCKNE